MSVGKVYSLVERGIKNLKKKERVYEVS